jgi:hypothetical protein
MGWGDVVFFRGIGWQVVEGVSHDDHEIRSGRWFRRLAGTFAENPLEEG